MIRFLVIRPIGVLVSFVALTLLAVTAFFYIPTSLLPNLDIPIIIIKINDDNQSVNQIEQSLTSPIRSNLFQLNKIRSIESTSSEGKSIITVRLDEGTNISTAFIEVNEKLDGLMNQLPNDAIRPSVFKLETSNIPIYNLNITDKDNGNIAIISNLVREVIKRRIEQLPEVAMVDLSGYVQPQIQLIPKEDYLSNLGLNQNELIDAFKENKIDLGNIMVKDGHYQYYLKFLSDFQNILAIENVPINIHGRLFKLGDLAKVSLGNAPENGEFFYNGRRAINLSIIKEQSVKIEELKKSFSSLLQHLREDFPQLNFEISQDQTSIIDYSIGNLWQDLALGGFLAFILMLIFIRKIRAALLIGLTIPLSLALSQLGFYMFGISLNIISLGGLILGLAMIIDNSIVVIDNINRLRDQGLDLTEAIVKGTNEVIPPLISSVLTNCAVFVPLIFMSGLAGAIFYDQAVSIIIGIVSSLIVAIVLLPPVYKLIYSQKGKKTTLIEIKSYVHVTGWYEFGLRKVFNNPLITCVIVGFLLCSSIFLFAILKKDRLPPVTKYDMELNIDWNENIELKENEKRINFLLKSIKGIGEHSVWLGEQQYLLSQSRETEYTQAKLYLKIKQSDSLFHKQRQIVNILAEIYPSALVNFYPAKNAFDEIFNDEQPPIRLNISTEKNATPSIDQTKLVIDKLQNILPNARINPIAIYNKIVLRIDAQKASLYRVKVAEIGKKVSTIFKAKFVDNYQDAQALVPIVIISQTPTSVNDAIENACINNADGIKIPLRTFLAIDGKTEYKYIISGAQGAYYPVDIYSTQPEIDIQKIQKLLAKDFNGLIVEYRGSYFDNNKLIGEMGIIFILSILLLYFILAAQFESLVQPLFVLIELPVALSGAFIFLYLGGNSLNLMSMIGIIVMGGLIINDSILKIDAINQLRRQGMPLLESIYEGGHKRLKPIVMISLTSIGSLLPTLFMNDLGSELQKPLALSLIGGMVVGLFVSLFFMPLLYWFVYRKKGEKISHSKHGSLNIMKLNDKKQ